MLPLVIGAAFAPFVPFLPGPQCDHPAENRIFDKVRLSAPYSRANALAASPDGRYVYMGEGGSMAIVDTTLGAPGFGAQAVRVPISGFGPRPAKILHDPGPSAGTDDDLLIICAGRSGLWVMDAHPADSNYRAAVVDDSGNNDVNVQKNRRFCNDAAVFDIDGVPYLAACFAKKNQSRVRIYDMASVRSVLANTPAGEWTGGELQSLHQIKINRRPGMLFETDPDNNRHNYGLTIGLDVDQESPTAATLYLANWHQGLVRVRVEAEAGGGLSVSPAEWGPVFGNGSAYNLDGSLSADERAVFSNMVWRLDGEVFREEPPVFTDVAVQNFCGHYLYATIDTLGWVRFDLSDPANNPWGEAMGIDHHEGEPYPIAPAQHPFGEVQFRLADIPGQDYIYPRQVRVVKSGQGAVLAVNGACQSMVKRLEHRTEGQVFDYAAAKFNGIPEEFFSSSCGGSDPGLVSGGGEHVFLYDLGCEAAVPVPMCLPSGPLDPPDPPAEEPVAPFFTSAYGTTEMELLPTATAGRLLLYTQNRNDTLVSEVTLYPPSVVPIGERTKADRPGHEGWKVTYSVVDPDLLLFSSNDGGYPARGAYATCGSELVNFFSPDGAGNDGRTSNGIFMDHRGQWPVLTPGHEGRQFMLATGPNRHYSLRLVDTGDPCSDPSVEPERVHIWKIRSHLHRLGNRHRWFFQSLVDDEYDANTGRNVVFLSGVGSPEGVVVLDRLALEAWIAPIPAVPDGSVTELNLLGAPLGVFLWALNTEPEFDQVPDGRVAGLPTFEFLQRQNYPGSTENILLTGKVQAYVPRLIKVAGSENGPKDTWILAAPCGYLDNGEKDLDEFGQQLQSYADHDYEADPPFDNFRRLLVRFWDVTDLSLAPQVQASIVGASEEGMALYLETAEHDGRTYLFVADFGGRIHVYDVSDVAWHPTEPVKLVELHDVAGSYTDVLPNNVWEVVVDRVQWSSGGQDFDEIYVYAAVERVGIEVFHFDPGCAEGNRLKRVQVVQTPGNPRSLVIRNQGGNKSLIVSDGEAGFRVMEYSF